MLALARALLTRAALALPLVPVTAGCGGEVQRPDGGAGLLATGAQPPALSKAAHNGDTINLRALGGKPTVVYFYPKDNTPGCTKEACAFRDAWDRLADANILIVGVSSDTNESHDGFAKEHKLPFPLISDPELEWANGFGVSSTAGFMSRVSFLIGPDGKVAKVYPEVDPGIHADEVIADVKALGA